MAMPTSNRYLGIGTIILPFNPSANSEDPAHLAENLAVTYSNQDPTQGKGGLTSKGWQTRKFCEYP